MTAKADRSVLCALPLVALPLLPLLALPLLAGALASCNTTQPSAGCQLARGEFIARYDLVEGTGACAQLSGELIGAQKYPALSGDLDERGFAPAPDFSAPTLALRPASLANPDSQFEARDPGATLNAVGAFEGNEPDGDTCRVPSLGAAKVDAPELNAGLDGGTLPAASLGYEFSDVVIEEGRALGHAFRANLTYRADGCVARYRVRAVWPAVSCSDGAGGLDPALCDPEKSGINPAVRVTCDAALESCVLVDES